MSEELQTLLEKLIPIAALLAGAMFGHIDISKYRNCQMQPSKRKEKNR